MARHGDAIWIYGSIPSAAVTDIGQVSDFFLDITGSTAITSLGDRAYCWKKLRFPTGGVTLTHNATSLKVPGNASHTTAAGDTCDAFSDADGNWTIFNYEKRANPPQLFGTASQYNIGSSAAAVPLLSSALNQFSGVVDHLNRIRRNGVISPPTLTGNVNDWSPTGFGSAGVLRASADSNGRQITGLAAGSQGDEIRIYNVGSFTFVLMQYNAGSAVANRIRFNGSTLTVGSGGSVDLWYDATSTWWVVTAIQGATLA